jgi:tetratricopeptide (TPR) repeat protein
MVGDADCSFVSQYLDRFLQKSGRDDLALEQVAGHVRTCSACYDRLSGFFKTIELPPSTFLRETIDELCGAMYQLAVGVIRERRDPEVNTDNMVSVYTRGSARNAAQDGLGMVDDAEDYVGEKGVGDVAFKDVRELIARAEMPREKKLDMARLLCEQILRFETRHTAVASNLLGVIHLWQGRRDEAEAAFLRTLAVRAGDAEDRVFKAFAHCNLGYLSREKGDLVAAVQSARRSVAIAEEIDEDSFYGLFALIYFLILQGPTAEAAARDAVAKLEAVERGRERFAEALRFENNREIAAVLRTSFIGREHAALLPPG